MATVAVLGLLFLVDLARAYHHRRLPSWLDLVFPVAVVAATAPLLAGTAVYSPGLGFGCCTGSSYVHAAAGAGVYVVVSGAVITAVGIVTLRLKPPTKRAIREIVPMT